MKHHNANRKFGREAGQRTAMLRALMKSLIIHGRVETTEARAKEIRSRIEKLITRAKTNDVATRRIIASRLGNSESAARMLIMDIAPKFKDRNGGYTRITKLGARSARGDAAKMAVIEFIA
jgi:large subunit ribosomal protein L17